MSFFEVPEFLKYYTTSWPSILHLRDRQACEAAFGVSYSQVCRYRGFVAAVPLLLTVAVCTIPLFIKTSSTRSLEKYVSKLLYALRLTRSKSFNDTALSTPPTVHIPRDIQLSARGHAAYSQALDTYGDVVIIPRHGRKEYVLDHVHVREVLTDATNFSFEKAVTNMLHMEFMLWFKNGTFVQELDRLVQEGLTPRLGSFVSEIAPIFEEEAHSLVDTDKPSGATEVSDVYHWTHRNLARAMVKLILGEKHLTSAMTQNFMETATAIAHLSGVYENTDGWTRMNWLWSLKTTLSAVFLTIIPRYFLSVVPQLWKERKTRLASHDASDGAKVTFFDLLAVKYRDPSTGKLGFWNFIWCTVICLGLVFASIHQSAVVAAWCILTLAKRQDEYLDELRAEWEEHADVTDDASSPYTAESLRKLVKLDSFIREVMRTKGDLFAPVRYTTQDVQIGRFMVPKDSLVVPYVKRVHEHPDNYSGKEFDGFQWARKEIPAVQGRHDFVSFGLGRWACPGRHLAINEVKLIMINLFRRYDVKLQGNDFAIVDPMNATSVAPEGILELTPRKAQA